MILVGGFGTRLRSVVSDRPKPMALVNGIPFIELLVGSLVAKGVRDFVLLTGYMGDMIEAHFQRIDRSGLNLLFSQEDMPLGTGGAVKNAEAFATDPTLLVNGDTFFDADLQDLLEFHNKNRMDVTLSLVRVDDASRYGSVMTTDDGRITGFVEKGQATGGAGWINAGLSLLTLDIIRDLPAGGNISMEREIFPCLAQGGRMAGLGQDRPFFDIGTPESYKQFKAFAKSRGISLSRIR